MGSVAIVSVSCLSDDGEEVFVRSDDIMSVTQGNEMLRDWLIFHTMDKGKWANGSVNVVVRRLHA